MATRDHQLQPLFVCRAELRILKELLQGSDRQAMILLTLEAIDGQKNNPVL